MAIASASATKTKALVLVSGFSTTAAIAAAPDWPSAYPAPAAAIPKAKLAARYLYPVDVVPPVDWATTGDGSEAIVSVRKIVAKNKTKALRKS